MEGLYCIKLRGSPIRTNSMYCIVCILNEIENKIRATIFCKIIRDKWSVFDFLDVSTYFAKDCIYPL